MATPVAPASAPLDLSRPTPSMAEVLTPPADFVAPNRGRAAARAKGARGPWVGWTVFGLLGLAVAATPVALWYAGILRVEGRQPDGDFTSGGDYTSPNFNYRFRLPIQSWKQDQAVGEETPRARLKASIALRRNDPNSWMTLALSKSDKRTPQEAELIDEGVERLRKWFAKDLEFEQTTERSGKPLALGGHPALRVVFRGEVGDVMMTGECFMVAHQGIAYWLTTWAPEVHAEQVFDEWDRLRDGFAILKDRDGWQEKQPKKLLLTSSKAPYTLTFTEGLWEKRNPVDYGADVDAALHGRDETEPTHADKTATALVLLLPKADDLKSAAAAARAHLERGHKVEYESSTFEDVVDKKTARPDGPPDEVGNSPGRLLRLHVKNGESRERFVLLGVVQLSEQLLVVQCECDWRRRTFWEVNFVNLVRSLQLKPK